MTATIKSKTFYDFYAHQFFKTYMTENKKRSIINTNTKFYLSFQEYNNILTDLNIGLRDLIINESFEFNIPYRLGVLSIKKSKPEPYFDEEGNLVNNRPVDWKATLSLWKEDEEAKTQKKLVRHTNQHSQGYVVKWHYDVKKANYTFKTAYKFVPCRAAKRLTAKTLTDPTTKVDYFLLR